MEKAIEAFDIEIDIDDRTTLYDYVTCQEVKKEGANQEWDPLQFTRLGVATGAIDKSKKLQITCMDKSISDKGFWQKSADAKKKRNTEPTFSFLSSTTSVNLPKRVLPLYKPGEKVKGHVIIKLTEPVPAHDLSINFMGSTVVNIRIYHRYGYEDYTRYEKYVEETSELWKKSEGNRNDLTRGYQNPLAGNTSTSKELSAGEHKFPFEFTIPMEAEPSMPNIKPGSVHYGYVVYRFKATLDSGKFWGRGDIVTHKGIWVTKANDIGRDLTKLRSFVPEKVMETGVCCFKKGNITVKAMIPRQAFVKGESIPVTLEIDYQSGSAIKEVFAYIQLHGKFTITRCNCIRRNKKSDLKSAKWHHDKIESGMCPSMTFTLNWDFSKESIDGNLMPTGTMDSSELLKIRYDVIVKLMRKGLRKNLKMEIPIYVGSFNSREGDVY